MDVAKEMAEEARRRHTLGVHLLKRHTDRTGDHLARTVRVDAEEEATGAFRAMAANICPRCGCALMVYEDSKALVLGQRCPQREITCSMGHKTALVMLNIEDETDDDAKLESYRRYGVTEEDAKRQEQEANR